MKLNKDILYSEIVDFVVQNFGKDRVVCVITYGSSLSTSEIPPKDYDFLILLSSYHKNDFEVLRKAKLLGYPIDLFIDYLDYITRKGIENYQRGRHGSYFFEVLANAKCLFGENYYKLNSGKIHQSIIKKDLLYRIEEYFYRIQKHYINDEYNEKTALTIKKYISRICMDLLLFCDEIKFEKMHAYHYLEILGKDITVSSIFSKDLQIFLKDYVNSTDKESVLKIIPLLYDVYLNCFEQNDR